MNTTEKAARKIGRNEARKERDDEILDKIVEIQRLAVSDEEIMGDNYPALIYLQTLANWIKES